MTLSRPSNRHTIYLDGLPLRGEPAFLKRLAAPLLAQGLDPYAPPHIPEPEPETPASLVLKMDPGYRALLRAKAAKGVAACPTRGYDVLTLNGSCCTTA